MYTVRRLSRSYSDRLLEEVVLPALLDAIPTRPVIFLAMHHAQARAACGKILEQHDYDVTVLDGRTPEESDEVLAVPRAR